MNVHRNFTGSNNKLFSGSFFFPCCVGSRRGDCMLSVRSLNSEKVPSNFYFFQMWIFSCFLSTLIGLFLALSSCSLFSNQLAEYYFCFCLDPISFVRGLYRGSAVFFAISLLVSLLPGKTLWLLITVGFRCITLSLVFGHLYLMKPENSDFFLTAVVFHAFLTLSASYYFDVWCLKPFISGEGYHCGLKNCLLLILLFFYLILDMLLEILFLKLFYVF